MLRCQIDIGLDGKSQEILSIGGSFPTPRPIALLHNFEGPLPLLPQVWWTWLLGSEARTPCRLPNHSKGLQPRSICRTFWKNSLRGWNNLHRVNLRLSLNFSTASSRHPTSTIGWENTASSCSEHKIPLGRSTHPHPGPPGPSKQKPPAEFIPMCLQLALRTTICTIFETGISQRAY
jgi:hypothetical protein